ncbi:HET-domain-containing protein [Setomelanomma holmii]|uniref:HET-domain-containing protein n=1 Tax=Setomelanomma holmii TaxID=210430 RepID=A0A9P4H4P9_9PLEO|nr:HET-domain-containing protein [Setomelanomma holmii]
MVKRNRQYGLSFGHKNAPSISRASEDISLSSIDEDHTDLFTHEPLDTNRRHIRLIKLQRNESCQRVNTHEDDIVCTIATFQSDRTPPYIALSYTWGAPTPTRTILVNSRPHHVRENLYAFLRAFKDHESNEQYLWIDQLCIDQTNTRERNHQVSMMANIYRSCHFVISWLDPNWSSCTAAQELRSRKYQFVGRKLMKSIEGLLYNRYFSRLWIVQEVLLARRVEVVCGNLWLGWNEIRDAILSLSEKRLDLLPNAKYLFTGKKETPIHWTNIPEHRLNLTLSECLTRYSSLKCENHRDKVYGLLGLVEGDYDVPVIDYNKSLQEVYLDTVRIFLKPNKSDRTLRAAARDALNLGRSMEFSKHDVQALTNMFLDVSILTTISAMGLKSSSSPTAHWWWYESCGEQYWFYRDGRYFEMRENVGAGQNLCYYLKSHAWREFEQVADEWIQSE